MRHFILAIVLLTTTLGFAVAEEVLLVETKNDYNERDDRLYLELDENDTPVELVHRAYDIIMGVYRVEELTKGISLRKFKGRDVLKLQITGFDPDAGGEATLTYLKRAIPLTQYDSIKFSVRRHKGRWRLFRLGDSRPIKSIFLRSNFSNVLGIRQPTGIKQIRFLRDRI